VWGGCLCCRAVVGRGSVVAYMYGHEVCLPASLVIDERRCLYGYLWRSSVPAGNATTENAYGRSKVISSYKTYRLVAAFGMNVPSS